ncbi:hypothetical protein B0H13DRAFT_2316695 [Mycena leptocephala]|nr:hypothetical protein B0H13DRAFT_2316695 [Mycena leptocephala]
MEAKSVQFTGGRHPSPEHLVVIVKYGAEEDTTVDPDMERMDAEINDEVGIAVVFDEEEHNEEDEERFEIGEDLDDDEKEPEDA